MSDPHGDDRHDVLENDVQRNPMQLAPYEAPGNVHHGGQSDHDKEVLELQVEEGDPLVQVAMNRRYFKRHVRTS